MKFTQIAAFFISALFAACEPDSVAQSSSSVKEEPSESVDKETYFPISIGESVASLQLALTDLEKRMGLMFRDRLEPNHGMAFLSKPMQQGFWMRNTRIPLDIGFFDKRGKLLQVKQMYPYDESIVASKSSEVAICIEMNQGWFKRNGLAPGALLDLSALEDAVTQRGESLPWEK